jgi:hypothetical protein
MQYFRAYQFLFESPKWFINLLIGVLCQILPIVGQIVLMGYLYDTIEAKHRYGRETVLDFNFDRLGSYFPRGAWPFLVLLILSVPAMVIVLPLAWLPLFFMQFPQPGAQPDFPVMFFWWFPLMMIAILAINVAIHLVSTPMTLRAGLGQDFGLAFSWSFIRDFFRRVGVELILSLLFLIVTAPFLLLSGILLCFVGIYAAIVLIVFAQYHLQYQLYELYLQRGGTPIPLKAA